MKQVPQTPFSTVRRAMTVAQVGWKLYRSTFRKNKKNIAKKSKEKAIAVRRALEELGSVFVKFGQFLSMRPDFLPLEYCDEMFYLLEDVPPFPYSEVENTFQEEFQTAPEQLFASFVKTPFASASFGQVYEAKLKSGEKVAVKIQRPGIKKTVAQDVIIMKAGAYILKLFPFIKIRFLPMVQEFERWVADELDYSQEIAYAELFSEEYKTNEDIIKSPEIFKKYCSDHILTSEFIEGISLNKIFAAYRTKNKKVIQKAEKMGFSRKYVADLIIKSFSRQFFGYGIFHADPHPANIIFTTDKQLACIDFGIVGNLNKRMRLQCSRYARFVLYGDDINATETFINEIDTSRTPNVEKLKQEHRQMVREYHKVFQQKDKEEGHRHFVGRFLFGGIQLVEKHKAEIPIDMLKFFRAFSMVESLIFFTNPETKIGYVARKFKNFAIAYALACFPEMLTAQTLQNAILGILNVVEKEILEQS